MFPRTFVFPRTRVLSPICCKNDVEDSSAKPDLMTVIHHVAESVMDVQRADLRRRRACEEMQTIIADCAVADDGTFDTRMLIKQFVGIDQHPTDAQMSRVV